MKTHNTCATYSQRLSSGTAAYSKLRGSQQTRFTRKTAITSKTDVDRQVTGSWQVGDIVSVDKYNLTMFIARRELRKVLFLALFGTVRDFFVCV